MEREKTEEAVSESGLRYTTDKPTTPGYYWYLRSMSDPEQGQIVRVEWMDGELVPFIGATECLAVAKSVGFWAGPIQMPSGPSKEEREKAEEAYFNQEIPEHMLSE